MPDLRSYFAGWLGGLGAGSGSSAASWSASDPREILEYGYQQQQRELVTVKRSLVEVATSKALLEREARKLRERIPVWTDEAQRALGLGREDLARESLQRKHAALAELDTLQLQAGEVGEEEARLTAALQKLALRIEEFRGRKGIVSARYCSAEARVRAADAMTWLSAEMAELNLALGRAEEETEHLQARAGALDALIESGVLAPAWGNADSLGQELRRLVLAQSAEAELEEIRPELGPGS
jgi:phage shock protein A